MDIRDKKKKALYEVNKNMVEPLNLFQMLML